MEHINEDTIRVQIKHADLEERGIEFLDLLGNQKQIEKFFYSILEEVDLEDEFQESDAVTFQVMPTSEGLELYISKDSAGPDIDSTTQNNVESIDAKQSSNFFNRIREMKEAEKNNLVDNEKEDIVKKVVELQNFDDAILLSERLYLEGGLSYLISYQNKYYIYFLFYKEEMLLRNPTEEWAVALEYGHKTKLTGDFLMEHGKILLEETALKSLRYYFK